MIESVYVIIPAFNEEKSIGKVIAEIPKWVTEIVVCNNNSIDNTQINAENAGATVVFEKQKGYGYACLKAMDYLSNKVKPNDIIVFLDADYSDYPSEMADVIAPLKDRAFDLVIGSRYLGNKEKGAMTMPQIFGNWLATFLIQRFYQIKFTDLGPFRALRWDNLQKINMQDKTYGWTVEMQVKAAKLKLKCTEVPVNYKKRIGQSKVSGTFKGVVLAGYKIITTIFKYM